MGNRKLYRKLLESIVLYNQYRNNLKYGEALDFGKELLKVNDLLAREKIIKNENILGDLQEFEEKVKSPRGRVVRPRLRQTLSRR